MRGAMRWHGILGLVVTGKLSCLLAALLVFSPRQLFTEAHHHVGSLDDQQVAGLLMLTACPLSYVVAGAVMAMQLSGIIRQRREPHAPAY
jgi:putative membrane protein